MGKQLTIRGVSEEIGRRLEALGRAQNKSVNRLVLDILEGAVGCKPRRRRLERYATWSEQDLAEFDEALKGQRVIDPEIWD